MRSFDLAVIGGGSAGLTAASIGGRVGARVLLVDRETLGGDCTHHGCVPSKALIRCAKVAHTARQAERFGTHVGDVRVDGAAALRYVRATVEKVKSGETPEVLRARGVEVAFGGATFLSPTRLKVGEEEVEAGRSILAVGSRALAPPIPGLREAGFIDHVGLFQLEDLVRRWVVIGGGPIGVEMGQALARLGATVTIVQGADRILERDDGELTTLRAGYLREELELILGAKVVEVARAGSGKAVTIEHEGSRRVLECDEVLVAVGRKTNLEGLGLEAAGVKTHARGIEVDKTLRTSAENIWACGDCTGGQQFTHFAEAQARVATRNALFLGSTAFREQWVPWTTFSDPELAHVGLVEADARRERRDDMRVYRFSYSELDRAVCEGETRGLAKVVCDPRGKILGASFLGPHAGEAISEIVIAMKAGLTLSKLAGAIHVYPTMNRIVRRLGDQRFLEEGVGRLTKKVFGRFKSHDA